METRKSEHSKTEYLLDLALKVWRKCLRDKVGAYAAQSAFFILLSIIPFIILLLQILSFLPYGRNDILMMSESLLPAYLTPLLEDIIRELYSVPVSLFWLTSITALWASSKAMHSITFGLDTISGLKKQRTWFELRFWALLYTVVFALVILFLLVSTVFWRKLTSTVGGVLTFMQRFTFFNTQLKILFDFILLTALFLLMYRAFPKRKLPWREHLPGALFASAGWVIFSEIFSLYVNSGSEQVTMYGSLAAIVLMMLWLYICMYLLMIGGCLNVVLRRLRIRKRREKAAERQAFAENTSAAGPEKPLDYEGLLEYDELDDLYDTGTLPVQETSDRLRRPKKHE